MVSDATRDVELGLLGSGVRLLAGMDEVGRGALAGPVTVGVAVVDAGVGEPPRGLRDSKMLSAARREALVDPVRAWVRGCAVASASPAEIDAHGIVGALRLAGTRALVDLSARGLVPDLVLLDGSHDWLSPAQADLLTALDAPVPLAGGQDATPRVVTRVRADAECAVVAAASVIAKVERDAVMTRLPDPGYGWARNKGYASAAHVEGLTRFGASAHHRCSWRLPGLPDGGRGGPA